ncbi:MAG: hypothetical protein JSU57_06230 [Candidatus Heimdallarchaeota archaeon]|nr:MAG: hypothetical protein JSU57_06230 [Candidatus Heimdallarchaeota archaeon]
MTGTKHFFIMCPPFEITGKKQLIVTKKGYFEISQNTIQYKIPNMTTDFLVLQPQEGIGTMTELPPYVDIDAFRLFHHLSEGMTEICFSLTGKRKEDLLLDFIFGEILPFTIRQYDSGFYQLRMLPDSIYQEFYRMSSTIAETMTTTISTFDENVFIPFKRKFISAIHNRTKTEETSTTIGTFSRDFPRFFKFHKDLLTILLAQAQQVSDHQHLSFHIFAPILRKIRMLNAMREFVSIEGRKKHIELKIKPMRLDSTEVAAKISPLVEMK